MMDYISDLDTITQEQADDPNLHEALDAVLFDIADEYRDEIIQMWIDDRLDRPDPEPAPVPRSAPRRPEPPPTETYEPRVEDNGNKFPLPKRATRHGYVYLVRGAGKYKIGITGQEVEKRIKGIQAQSPVGVDLVHSFASADYRRAERFLHERFSDRRLHYEWFNLRWQDVIWITKIKDYDLDDKLD